MKNGMVWVALVALTAATGLAQGTREANPETVIRWQFAGTDHLRQLKQQQSLAKVLALPQTGHLREVALTSLSRRAAERFGRQAPAEARQKVEQQVRALLPDVLAKETRFEMVTMGTNADWALALKLPEERHRAWRSGLSDLSRAAGLTVSDEENWKASRGDYSISLKREKGWTLVEGGHIAGPSREKLFNDFRRDLGKAEDELLIAEFDLPKLGDVWKAQRLAHAPKLKLKAAPNRDGIRSEAELEYPRDLGLKPEKWNVPAKLINEPLIGFTAMQGLGEALGRSPLLKSLGVKNVPNQLFTWALSDTPFSTYFAANVGNPQTVVSNLAGHLTEKAKTGFLLGQPQWGTNGTGFILRGLPVITPFFEAATGNLSQFIYGGFFPVARKEARSAPAELFAQLNKKDLIYYEWEITEARLKHWRPLWQVGQMVNPRRALLGNAGSEQWIDAIMPLLGNTITEGVLEGDRKINVVRQSHVGFNALELVLLAHWLDPNDVREMDAGAQPGNAPGEKSGQSPKSGSQDAKAGR